MYHFCKIVCHCNWIQRPDMILVLSFNVVAFIAIVQKGMGCENSCSAASVHVVMLREVYHQHYFSEVYSISNLVLDSNPVYLIHIKSGRCVLSYLLHESFPSHSVPHLLADPNQYVEAKDCRHHKVHEYC